MSTYENFHDTLYKIQAHNTITPITAVLIQEHHISHRYQLTAPFTSAIEQVEQEVATTRRQQQQDRDQQQRQRPRHQ